MNCRQFGWALAGPFDVSRESVSLFVIVETKGTRSACIQSDGLVLPVSPACPVRIPESRGYGCLIESATVLLPPVRGEAQGLLRFTGLWQPSFQARVCAMPMEIALKNAEFYLQFGRRPE